MLKLIKLEWKKNHIGTYIRNALILAAVLCLFMFALAYLGIVNDPDTGDLTMADNAIFPVVLTLISLIFAFLSIHGAETKDFM